MAKGRRAAASAERLDEDRWLAGLMEDLRSKIAQMMGVFDQCPRRPDEEAWRAAFVDHLVGLVQDQVRNGYLAVGGDFGAIEGRVLRLLIAMDGAIKVQLEERRADAGAGAMQA